MDILATQRIVLLNPGPVTLSERVRRALMRPDACHREADFMALADSVRQRLAGVYTPSGLQCALLTGSGTAAVESMLATLAPRATRTLVAVNGVYGERMAAMLAAHGKPHTVAAHDWMAPLDVVAIERQLADDPSLTHVAAVHLETTTGRLNDVAALGQSCRRRGRRLLLDAVSSFGAEDIPTDSVEALAATANKCLHGVPGVCFVLYRSLDGVDADASSVYFDLRRYARDPMPFTLAVQPLYALDEALHELAEQGGWTARRARSRALTAAVRTRLQALGVEPLIDPDLSSSVLTAYRLPAGRTYGEVHDVLRAAGFVIYAGQGTLAGQVFRIATMGDVTEADLERLLDALPAALGRAPADVRT